jgi:hypothetical protein
MELGPEKETQYSTQQSIRRPATERIHRFQKWPIVTEIAGWV